MPTPQLLRLVVDDLTEIIVRFKPDGTLTFVNDVYCRFFGKTRAELLGSKWQPKAMVEDLPLIEEKLRQLSPENPVVVIENRVRNAKGDIRWLQFVNRALYDAHGQHLETQAVARDITGHKLLEAELQRLNAELEQRVAERTVSLAEANAALLQEIAERKEAEAARRTIEHALQARSIELEETNSALRVLLRQREQDRQELEQRLEGNIRQLIIPYLQVLKKISLSAEGCACLNVIETNLNDVLSSFAGQPTQRLATLSPKELLVANLVREGEPDKVIAQTLRLSIDTVKAHRRNIRKKLDLTGKKNNLRAHLVSLSQNR